MIYGGIQFLDPRRKGIAEINMATATFLPILWTRFARKGKRRGAREGEREGTDVFTDRARSW